MKCTVLRAERGKTNPMKYLEAVTARATLHEIHTQLAMTDTRKYPRPWQALTTLWMFYSLHNSEQKAQQAGSVTQRAECV
jgi:hypothetical protein